MRTSPSVLTWIFSIDHCNRMYLLDTPSEFNNPFHGIPGAAWAERARDLAMREIANPSLSTMMVCDSSAWLLPSLAVLL